MIKKISVRAWGYKKTKSVLQNRDRRGPVGPQSLGDSDWPCLLSHRPPPYCRTLAVCCKNYVV